MDSHGGAKPPPLLPRCCCCAFLCPCCLQVTVLAVFQKLGADANLFALVLGESLMNDAVAIVLFRSLSTFLQAPVTAVAVLRCVASMEAKEVIAALTTLRVCARSGELQLCACS